jgi:hypothetical protein
MSYFLYQLYHSSCTHSWTKDYLKKEGVPEYPLSHLRRHELKYAHVEMGSLLRQAVVGPITSRPMQAEGTGESDGLPCKYYIDTLTSYFLYFPL